MTKPPLKLDLPQGHVVSESVAITDVKKFVEFHSDKLLSDDAITDAYPNVIIAVQRGKFDMSDMSAPVLTLKEPIKFDSGGTDMDKLTFRTRIKASTQQDLAKGVNMAKEQMRYINICRAYFAGLDTPVYLDKLSKFDFGVVEQLSNLFQ